jgi:hypothetical protein
VEVLHQPIKGRPPPCCPRVLGDARHAAEVAAGGQTRHIGFFSRVDPILRVDGDVSGELVLEVLLSPPATEGFEHGTLAFCGSHDEVDRRDEPLPLSLLRHELFPARARETVVLCSLALV